MLRIETADSGNLVTLVLSGRIENADLRELRNVLEQYNKPVVLDLQAVKLVDRDAIMFLANFEAGNAKITNCPTYIREWIRRERAQQLDAGRQSA
jgi:hypothetical protein